MKQIPLTKGLFAIVDDEDYEYLNLFQWRALKHRTGKHYAIAKIDGKHILMHRMIMKVSNRLDIVDHRDGFSLNNARSNLRVCTNSQNMMNRGPVKHRGNEYKGVVKIERKMKTCWKAQIGLNGRTRCIGFYNTPKDAAIAYNQKAIELHGEFAFLNAI